METPCLWYATVRRSVGQGKEGEGEGGGVYAPAHLDTFQPCSSMYYYVLERRRERETQATQSPTPNSRIMVEGGRKDPRKEKRERERGSRSKNSRWRKAQQTLHFPLLPSFSDIPNLFVVVCV